MTRERVEVLLVEDNPTDVDLTFYALRNGKLENHIQVVHDGAEALDYVFRTGSHSGRRPEDRPGLILLDVDLPKVDGIDVLRKIKADETTRSIPVVMLTSSSEERDIVESYGLGANSYVVKPVDFEQFSHAVQQIGRYWLLLDEHARAPAEGWRGDGQDGT